MPFLQVEVVDRDGAAVSGVVVSGGPPEGEGLDPSQALAAASAGRLEVPDDGQLVVRLERDDARGLPLQVALDLADDDRPAFRHGARPAAMQLHAVRAANQTDAVSFSLRVVWGEVQELVFASGSNPTDNFASLARGRLARLAKTGEVETSCVLTLFQFSADPPKGWPDATYQLFQRRYLVDVRHRRRLSRNQLAQGQGTLLLSERVWEGRGDEISVLTYYGYLAEVGRTRPGTVREVGLFSHAYWIGPVLLNTGRAAPFCNETTTDWSAHRRCATRECHDHCPTDRQHEALTRMRVPVLRDYDPAYRYLTRRGVKVLPYLNVVLSQRDPAHDGLGVHRRRADDRDPRNTDFVLGMMNVSVVEMRAALHADAILRVWGCNNGALGPLFRIWRKKSHRDQPNRRLKVRATWQRHGDPAQLEWRPREGDARLQFLSRLRRCYAQAFAQALERPCYGAVPGTYGEYLPEKLGAMEAKASGLMGPYALDQLYPQGVPDDELTARDRRELELREGAAAEPGQLVDPGGYFRFSPTPRPARIELTVLVTGFLPFRDGAGRLAPFNTSGEVVRALAELDVAARVHAPPWVELALNVECDPEVDVVWTCAAERQEDAGAPARATPPAGPGGADRILAKAEAVKADIVVIVGESQRLTAEEHDLRLERFAGNRGTDKVTDNARQQLRSDGAGWRDVEDHGQRFRAGPIFPRRDAAETLESTVPLRAWLQCLARLRRDAPGLRVHNGPGTNITSSTGMFVCNETFYQLLIESREGSRGLGRRVPGARPVPATGRWVEMVHVASQLIRRSGERWQRVAELDGTARAAHERLTDGLATLVASLVEEQLWASDVGEMEITHEGETTPAWPAPRGDPDWFQLTVRDEDDQPAEGVELSLTAADGSEHLATTDADGVARWEGLPPGEVRFELPEGFASLDPAQVDRELGPADEVEATA